MNEPSDQALADPGDPGTSGTLGAPATPRQPAAWRTGVAWLAIVAACTLVALRPWESEEGAEEGSADVGLVVTQLEARYIVGAAQLVSEADPMLYGQAKGTLDAGTVAQRQRFVIVAAELADPATARRQLEELDELMTSPKVGAPPELDEQTRQVDAILRKLYPPELVDAPEGEARRIAREAAQGLAPEERQTLLDSLGWFGELALPGAPHDRALQSAVIVAIVAIFTAGAGVLGLVAGLAFLIVTAVLLTTGRLRGGLPAPRSPHVYFAETFAIWLVLFMGAQVAIGRLAPPSLHMPLIVLVFPLSLGALAWPVINGAPWNDVRRDVGLTLGRGAVREALCGAGGYLGTLPLLGIGVLMTLGLYLLQSLTQADPDTFAPAGGPAHPVIVEMAGGGVWPKLQILALAAVCAPLVEETMFRGVLYRSVRSATWKLGRGASIAIGTAVNTFLFAAIHPQGALAIPALMGLATGMTLLREWRDSLLPSMIVHGISNGLVMCLLWALLGM